MRSDLSPFSCASNRCVHSAIRQSTADSVNIADVVASTDGILTGMQEIIDIVTVKYLSDVKCAADEFKHASVQEGLGTFSKILIKPSKSNIRYSEVTVEYRVEFLAVSEAEVRSRRASPVTIALLICANYTFMY